MGICEMPTGELVIADFNNENIKLLNRKFKVTDSCHFPGKPYHLCHTERNEVAVAVFREIHFFSVTSWKLQAVRNFSTDFICSSIAHHQGTLYIASPREGLYQCNMKGKAVKKVYKFEEQFRVLISRVHNCLPLTCSFLSNTLMHTLKVAR